MAAETAVSLPAHGACVEQCRRHFRAPATKLCGVAGKGRDQLPRQLQQCCTNLNALARRRQCAPCRAHHPLHILDHAPWCYSHLQQELRPSGKHWARHQKLGRGAEHKPSLLSVAPLQLQRFSSRYPRCIHVFHCAELPGRCCAVGFERGKWLILLCLSVASWKGKLSNQCMTVSHCDAVFRLQTIPAIPGFTSASQAPPRNPAPGGRYQTRTCLDYT